MQNKAMITVGSVCSGIEAASVAWNNANWEFSWFSEIEDFPSNVLSKTYPNVTNIGDMAAISDMIENESIGTPDLICGGTPCQAFSLAGIQKGLENDRGNLTLNFVDIIEVNDKVRRKKGLNDSMVLWENVEGVLSD